VIAHYHYTRCVLRILSGARRCSLRHGGGAGHAKDAGASARRAPFWLRNDLKIGAQKEADRLHAALPRSSPTSVASKRNGPDLKVGATAPRWLVIIGGTGSGHLAAR
jgi:hypothetical protein